MSEKGKIPGYDHGHMLFEICTVTVQRESCKNHMTIARNFYFEPKRTFVCMPVCQILPIFQPITEQLNSWNFRAVLLLVHSLSLPHKNIRIKGQLISKAIYGLLTSPKKQICFWEKLCYGSTILFRDLLTFSRKVKITFSLVIQKYAWVQCRSSWLWSYAFCRPCTELFLPNS